MGKDRVDALTPLRRRRRDLDNPRPQGGSVSQFSTFDYASTDTLDFESTPTSSAS